MMILWGRSAPRPIFRELETGIIQTLERLTGTDPSKEHDIIGNFPSLGSGERTVKRVDGHCDAIASNIHQAYVEWNVVTSELESDEWGCAVVDE